MFDFFAPPPPEAPKGIEAVPTPQEAAAALGPSPTMGNRPDLAALMQNDPSAAKKALNKARKAHKKARRKAMEAAEENQRAAKTAARKREEAVFKESIKDGYVVDGNGERLRRYSLAEQILDNKPVSYTIAALAVVVPLLAIAWISFGGR